MRFTTKSQPGDDKKMAALVAGSYFQGIQIGFGGGTFVAPGINGVQIAAQPYSWVLRQGSYNQYRGYWIFTSGPVPSHCWQAVNCNGPIAFWNWGGQGAGPGNPEDWELFNFVLIDAPSNTVAIQNIYGRYVRYAPPGLACDAGPQNEGYFNIVF